MYLYICKSGMLNRAVVEALLPQGDDACVFDLPSRSGNITKKAAITEALKSVLPQQHVHLCDTSYSSL
jgi:hypothetical protein